LGNFHTVRPIYFQLKNDWQSILLKKNAIKEIQLNQTGAHLFI
jgi:hypothetical protein